MPSEDNSRSKLERLAYVAAIFAGASALLYVLGVITLWVQVINYRNTQDFYTSAYAVATIPSTVTAGVGVKTIVDTLWAAISATYIYVIFFLVYIAGVLAIDYWKSRKEGDIAPDHAGIPSDEQQHEDESEEHGEESDPPESSHSNSIWLRLLGSIWIWIVFWSVVFVVKDVLAYMKGTYLWNEAISDACLLCGAYIGVYLVWYHLDHLRWALVGLVVILGSAYISSVFAAFSASPSLPIVRFWGPEVNAAASDRMFYLLSHSEGYWSVLDSEGDVLAIPDDREEHIQLVERDDVFVWRLLIESRATGDYETAINSMEYLNEGSGRFLGGVDVEGANLSKIDLYDEDKVVGARGAILVYANMQKAELRRADLREANFYGAKLEGTDLQCANLKGAIGLNQDAISSANGDSTTQLSNTLKTPKSWPQATQDEIKDCKDYWRDK